MPLLAYFVGAASAFFFGGLMIGLFTDSSPAWGLVSIPAAVVVMYLLDVAFDYYDKRNSLKGWGAEW